MLRFEDIELTVSDIKNLVNYKDLNEKVKAITIIMHDWTTIYLMCTICTSDNFVSNEHNNEALYERTSAKSAWSFCIRNEI